jgi:hypothetical protein
MLYLSVLRCKQLKIKSNFDGVPDFYTSPYLVRKTFGIGFDLPDQPVSSNQDECSSFLNDDYVKLDTRWRSTMVLQMIGIAVGALICVGLLVSICCEWSSNFYRMTGCVWILICTLFTGLSFLILDSILCTDNPYLREMEIQQFYDKDCKIASGSIMLIIGIVLMFLTGLVSCAIKGNDEPRKKKEKKQDEENVEEPTNEPEPEEPIEEREPEPDPEPVEEPEPAEDEPPVTEETNVGDEETAKEGGQDEFDSLYESSEVTDADVFKSAVKAD